MSITPTGCLSLPLLGLARLVASSATFRTVVDAANVSAALAKVFLCEVEEPLDKRPLCVISNDKDTQWTRDRYGNCSGTLIVSFEFPENVLYATAGERLVDFSNTVGAILDEMFEKVGTPDGSGYIHCNMVSASQIEPPAYANYADDDCGPDDVPFIGCSLEVAWQ